MQYRDELSTNCESNCHNLQAREELSWITVTYHKCNCNASCKLAQKQVICISQSRQSESNEARKKASKTNHKRLQWNQQSATSHRDNPCKLQDAITLNSAKLQKAIAKRPTSCKCNYNETLASTIAKKQKCHCNRPCKLHKQLWWLWSAGTTATSQKNWALNQTWQSTICWPVLPVQDK